MAEPYKATIPTGSIRSPRTQNKEAGPNRAFSLAQPEKAANENIIRSKLTVENVGSKFPTTNEVVKSTESLVNKGLKEGKINSFTGKTVEDITIEKIDYPKDNSINREKNNITMGGPQKPNTTNTKLPNSEILDNNQSTLNRRNELNYNLLETRRYDPASSGVIFPYRDQCPPISPQPGILGTYYVYDPVLGWIPVNP